MLQQKELISEFLGKNGPSLPVEIGKELGYNSLLTKAVLTELINENVILQSKRTIGNSLLYFLHGQERLLRKRLYDDLSIPERHCLNRLRDAGRPLSSDELSPQERYVVNTLYDFIDVKLVNNQRIYSLKGVAERPQVIQISKPVIIPPVETEPSLFKPKPEPKMSGGFDDEIISYLKRLGSVSVKRVIRRDRETNYVLKTKEPFSQVFFVKSKNKKRINESDLSLIYTETLQEKMPGLLITKGDLTNSAKKWMKDNVGDLIKLIRIK
jgi:hypothetical protein